jgi:voltage-gated potassium channel
LLRSVFYRDRDFQLESANTEPDMRYYIRRFLGTLMFFAAILALGTVGYQVVEGWSLGDSFYMTVITVTAVGFAEVHPLSHAGRLLTLFVLFGGITGMGLWFAFLTSFIVELDLRNVLRRRRTMKEIAHMKDHVIVCGAGRTGGQVVEEFIMSGQPFTVIEADPDKVGQLHALAGQTTIIQGDATIDHYLEDAGIDHACGLIACLSSDTDNLFVCLSARDLKPDLKIVARAFEEQTIHKLYRAGADHVVSPNQSGAIRMASLFLRPSVVSFLDVATRSPDLSLRLEQQPVGEKSKMAGKSLMEAKIPQRTGLIVIAVRKKLEEEGDMEYEFVFNPVADTRLEPGDQMIVLGREDQIRELKSYVEG